jgi:hypothetical protein
MTGKKGAERAEHLVAVLREWQEIERNGINDLSRITEKTGNPLVRLIMEIIRHDSIMHHRVQQFLIDSETVSAPSLSRDELGDIWDAIESHDRAEKRTIELAGELLADAWTPVQKQLLGYLLQDESKHDELLRQLTELKGAMNRITGA